MHTASGVVIETGSGIGFEINAAQGSPIYKYSVGDQVQIFTEMVVREDGVSLFGFHNMESLEFFRMLTSVSGIGPKGAMAILGSMPLSELKQAIAFGDVKTISRAQGVGKKTAERLVVELKDKIGSFELDTDAVTLSELGGSGHTADDGRSEAINALVALGYSKQEAFGAVSHVTEEGLTAEEYIKAALKRLF